MDIEKLIERLKKTCWGESAHKVDEERRQAAEALTALQAENERLKSENIMHKNAADDYYNTSEEYRRERNDLLEELEKVKAERDAYKIYFDDLSSKPDCNTCDDRDCRYRPRAGDTVRVNCPLWRGKKEE